MLDSQGVFLSIKWALTGIGNSLKYLFAKLNSAILLTLLGLVGKNVSDLVGTIKTADDNKLWVYHIYRQNLEKIALIFHSLGDVLMIVKLRKETKIKGNE